MKIKNFPILLFLFITGSILLMRLGTFYAPLDRDGGVFAYIGARILAGDLPYRDTWDHKPPAIYYLDALALTVFGHTVASLRYMEIIFALATAWAIYRLGLKVLGNHWAASSAALSFSLASNSYMFSPNGADLHFTESFMLLPMVLGISLVTPPQGWKWYRFLWAGIMGALAILFKPPGGFFLAAVVLWAVQLAWQAREYRTNLLICLGNLVIGVTCPIVLVIAYFTWQGGLADLYSQVIFYNSVYISHFSQSSLQNLYGHTIQWLSSLGFIWIPAGLGLFWAKASNKNLRLLILWFIFDLGGAILGGKYYSHYFLQVLPSLTLLAGYGWLALKDRGWLTLQGFRNMALISGIIVTSLALLILQFMFISTWMAFRQNGNLTPTEQAAQFFAANTNKEEKIYVWGADTAIYFLSDRQGASRYIYLYPLLAPGYTSSEQVNELLRDIETQKPRYILDVSSSNELIPPLEGKSSHQKNDTLYAQDDLDPLRLFITRQYHPHSGLNNGVLYEQNVAKKNLANCDANINH